MSPWRSRRRVEPPGGPSYGDIGRVEEHPDGDWSVRAVPGASATKAYRCPGCDQEIRPATPHLVAWPAAAPDHRRHWHSACWAARARRTVKVHRAKNAPHYG